MGYCKTDFMNYMKKTVSPYHAVAAGAEILEAAGFQKLSIKNPFVLAVILQSEKYIFFCTQ